MMKERGFGLITVLLLLLLLVVVGSTVYLNWSGKNQDNEQKGSLSETSNQKASEVRLVSPSPRVSVFRDEELGFEILLPAGLNIKKDSEVNYYARNKGDFRRNFTGYIGYPPARVLGATVVLKQSESIDNPRFLVWIFENNERLNEADWYDRYWYYPFLWGDFSVDTKSKVAPNEEVLIGGVSGRSAVVSYQPEKPWFVYVVRDNRTFLFRLTGEGVLGNGVGQINFKFLK